MKDLDPLYNELSYYFGIGKLNNIPQKERNQILEDLRLKIFEFLERNLQTFSEDILDFIFEGLSKLGLEFEDLISTPQIINKKILDILFSLTLKDIYCETRYYLISVIKKICEVFRDSKGEKINTFNYLKKKIAYFLINYNFNTIKDLIDEGIFNYLDDEELIKIYENPYVNLERKLNKGLYKTDSAYYSSTMENTEKLYTKLGEYGIAPLLKWIAQDTDPGISEHVCVFFSKMGSNIIKPFKSCIQKQLDNKEFSTIEKLMNYKLIELLDKNTIIEIFWDDKEKYLEKTIDWALEIKYDLMIERVINLIKKIGGDAFKLLYKAFKFSYWPELIVSIINDFKNTDIEEIDNLKEGILYADKINNMVYPMIIILCDFLIKRISKEERRNLILNTNIVESILETSIPYPFNINPLERLHFYAHEILREKIFNIFMKPNTIAIARILNNHSYYMLLRGRILTTKNWKSIIENPNKNFFETLTEAINYVEQNFCWDWPASNFAYNIFHDFLIVSLIDPIRNKIIDSFMQKNVNAISSIFKLGLEGCFTKQELFTLIEDSFDVCIVSQSKNYSTKLQNFIDEIFKKDPDAYREILSRILKDNSKYSERISKYAFNKGYLK